MSPSNNLNIYQGLKQELGLKLTPEMRLRLDVLQATNLELRDILNKELEENPIIEDVLAAEDDSKVKDRADDRKEKTDDINMDGDVGRMDEIDRDEYENVFGRESYEPLRGFESEYNPELGKIRDFKYNSIEADEEVTLHEELHRQLLAMGIKDEAHVAVYKLIPYVDDNGFIKTPVADICTDTGLSEEAVKKAIAIIQSFEPAGVGAPDAREALLIQLRRMNLKDSLAYQIVEKKFDILAKQQYDKLASIFKVSVENINKAGDIIKGLSPSPGKNFSSDKTEYVTPDVIVEEDEETGDYEIKIPGEFPEIKINRKYLDLYKNNKQTKDFIKKYENRVKTLIGSLGERNKTVKKVVEKIIAVQKDFLKDEKKGLKPLTLKEIADDVQVHESTISRIVSRKYIQLPTGVFSLKKFFSSKLSSSEGNVSSHSVKAKIVEIIENEDKSKPFTDTEIAKMLNSGGINISRRTVTKYREQSNILPVNNRKK